MRRFDVDWAAQPLGTVPDAQIAAALGCSVHTVRRARVRRGIRPTHAAAAERRGIDWDAQPLGREPDHAIARRLGVHPSSVGSARQRRGIAAFDPVLEIARLRAAVKRAGAGQ